MIVLRCPKHPRYNGVTPPRAACQGCQALERLRVLILGRTWTYDPDSKFYEGLEVVCRK